MPHDHELSDRLARAERELATTRAQLDRVLHHPVMRAYSGLRSLPPLRRLAARRDRRLEAAMPEPAAAPAPEPAGDDGFERRTTWMFGTGRSGSTWLMRLIASHPDVVAMHEPWLGHHLAPFNLWMQQPEVPGDFFAFMRTAFRDDPDYFFAAEFSDRWRPRLRELVIDRLRAHVDLVEPVRGAGDPALRLLVREPNAAWAAETIMGLLPRARMLHLLRDGRDVIDSLLDGYRPGGWLNEETPSIVVTPENRLSFIESNAIAWVHTIDAVGRAFDAHPQADRLLVRYEDLLADTPRELERVLRWLGLPDAGRVADDAAGQHRFGAASAGDTGSGRPERAASPGLWREHFSAEEQALVERIMGAKLRALGYPDG